MKSAPKHKASAGSRVDSTTEILILPNGTVYAHNITPQMARLLVLLDPADGAMLERAGTQGLEKVKNTFPNRAL